MQPQDPSQPSPDTNNFQPPPQPMPVDPQQPPMQPAPMPQAYAPPAQPMQPQQTMPAGPKTNVMAILSLVLGIVLSFVIPIIGPIVGAILGFVALSQIKTSGEGGRGLAIAGIIVSGCFMLFTIGIIILWIVLFSAAATLKPTTTTSGSSTQSTSTFQSQTGATQGSGTVSH